MNELIREIINWNGLQYSLGVYCNGVIRDYEIEETTEGYTISDDEGNMLTLPRSCQKITLIEEGLYEITYDYITIVILNIET